jgi:HD-GYP domain-containing protein (c-di-GMP phosphodiesterase class II)
LAGFSSHERRMIQIAAYLHDLGKLAIPSEILEKRDKLTEDECFIMRSHVYHTYQTLEPFEALGTINSWGSLHQERLNGTGYPFGDKEDELPLGSRIIAVADVFTALTEHRPYRQQSMEKKAALEVLHSMAGNGELDNHLIHIMATHYDEMNEIRDTAQQQAIHEYDEFQKSLNPQGNVLKKRLGWKSTVS